MRYIADLHIHSPFSRATSKAGHLRGLAAWAAVKGIDLLATGDFTHPAWFAHLNEELVEAEPGLFRLKPAPGYDYAALLPEGMRPARNPEDTRFLLGTEISCIYKRGGRVRKVHNLIYAPDMDAARRINTRLADLGNIQADGRPILGLDSRDLLEITLELAPGSFFVPAHVWTPWFSLFGSKSGFDRIEDCFADLTPHIFALETGLSSDPAMNRLLSALDGYTMVSNSDCHSPQKLGREANLFDTGLDFASLREAIRAPFAEGRQRFLATVEFFPEEGKYHADGHRKCGVCLEPEKTRELGGRCPVCGGPLTVGVLHRVLELADRAEPVFPPHSPAVHSLIPLPELAAELLDVGPTSKQVTAACVRLINRFGSEFTLLLDTPLEDLRRESELLAEAVSRVRNNAVIKNPGYDGEFGVMRVFAEGERQRLLGQGALFAGAEPPRKRPGRKPKKLEAPAPPPLQSAEPGPPRAALNAAQQAAVMSDAPVIVVQAGPGTGKTHTLASRVRRFLDMGESGPITVITFTNKAADELKARLPGNQKLRVATFHGYCLELLRMERPELAVVGPEEREAALDALFPGKTAPERRRIAADIARFLLADEDEAPPEVRAYLDRLAGQNLIDLDALCREVFHVLRAGGERAARFREATGRLFVDEFQDVNAAQYGLAAQLAATNPVFCIGDPDQSIYGFRGAGPQWFFRLMDDFAAERHALVENYRSGAEIVRAAASVIRRNPHKLEPPEPLALSPRSAHIHVQSCPGPLEEARFIADQIEAQTGGLSHRALERMTPTGEGESVGLADIAVLFRSLRLADAVRETLTRRGIPFRQVDVEAWYMRGPCRLVYGWLLLLAGRGAVAEFLHLAGEEPGVGEARLGRLQSFLRSLPADAPLLPALNEAPAGLIPGSFQRLAEQSSSSLLTPHSSLTLPEFVEALAQKLANHYRFAPNDPALDQLAQHAHSFENLPAFAAHLERYSDSVLYDAQAQAVTLSTLHAAKGLEFDAVFIAGCEQGLLPIAPREPLAGEALAAHIAEERRLFYVGMTRARRTLYCTWCAVRRGFQDSAMAARGPSPFLFEFPQELTSPPPSVRPETKKRRRARQLSLF